MFATLTNEEIIKLHTLIWDARLHDVIGYADFCAEATKRGILHKVEDTTRINAIADQQEVRYRVALSVSSRRQVDDDEDHARAIRSDMLRVRLDNAIYALGCELAHFEEVF